MLWMFIRIAYNISFSLDSSRRGDPNEHHNICFMENNRKLSFNYHQISPLSVLLLPGGNILIFCTFYIFNILGNFFAQFIDMIMHINYEGLLTQTRMGLTWLNSSLVSIIGPMRCLYRLSAKWSYPPPP